jgi:peroxiredoxin
MKPSTSSGLGGSFMMGIIFSAGWTPCIGPLLGTILTVAARTGDVPQAAATLTAYSLGLGIPFLITAGLMEGAQSILRRLQKYMGKIELLSGLLLIIIGIAVATGSLQNLSQSLSGQTELATRIEDCGLGFLEAHLDLGQTSSCLDGSLKPVSVGQTAITEFSAEDKSQSFLFEIDKPTVVDVELAGVTKIFSAEVAIFDAEGNQLGRGSEFVEIDENKYVLLQGLALAETGQYLATITFTGETDEPFSFRFRVRKSQEIEGDSASNEVTTINIASSNLGTITDLAASTEPIIGLEMGNRAPNFDVTTIDGDHTSLAELRGRIVLINFWGTWCAPCIREMPDLQTVYEQYADSNFTILALATRGDTKEDVLAFRDEYKLSFPLVVDEGDQISEMYSIVSRPSTIIIDKNGVIAFKHFGPIIESQLVEVLNEILSS